MADPRAERFRGVPVEPRRPDPRQSGIVTLAAQQKQAFQTSAIRLHEPATPVNNQS
jgi:hypothetical protein